MRHYIRSRICPGAIAPVLSFEDLVGHLDPNGLEAFDARDLSPLPDEEFERTEMRKAVNSFLDSLAPRDQEIIRGIFWEEKTRTAIAKDLRVSKMAISKAMSRISEQGRSVLDPYRSLEHVN